MTPLSLFIAEENETMLTRIVTEPSSDTLEGPVTNTSDIHLDTSSILERLQQLESSAKARDNRLRDCEAELREHKRRLLESERLARERDAECERLVRERDAECERLVRERDARIVRCEQQMRDYEQRFLRYEEQLRARDVRIRECEEQMRDGIVTARARPRPRPDISNIQLTPMDIERVHEHDSLTGAHSLAQEEIARTRNSSKSKRMFVANLTRKMFSMEERIRDCNVAGIRNRPPLSPTKTRFERICVYTSQQFGCAMDVALRAEVRKTVDDTNRRYREDLKVRKSRFEAEGEIHQVPRDDFDMDEGY